MCCLARWPSRPVSGVGHIHRYITDGSLLTKLGWAPTTPWEKGLEATVAWYSDAKNRQRWGTTKLNSTLVAVAALAGPAAAPVAVPAVQDSPTTPLPVIGCRLTKLKKFTDQRGLFSELSNTTKDFQKNGNRVVRQISLSVSGDGVFRGLHCSKYGKLVTCIAGSLVVRWLRTQR